MTADNDNLKDLVSFGNSEDHVLQTKFKVEHLVLTNNLWKHFWCRKKVYKLVKSKSGRNKAKMTLRYSRSVALVLFGKPYIIYPIVQITLFQRCIRVLQSNYLKEIKSCQKIVDITSERFQRWIRLFHPRVGNSSLQDAQHDILQFCGHDNLSLDRNNIDIIS